jgi:hypothetical protein
MAPTIAQIVGAFAEDIHHAQARRGKEQPRAV